MRARVVLLGVVLLAVAVGWAAAASLAVTGGQLSVAESAHPCPGTASASASGGSVTVTLTSAACAGRNVHLTTLTSAGGAVGSGSATVSGSTALVSVSTAGAVGAVATVDGWTLPLTWTGTGPIYPGTPGVALTQISWDLLTNNPTQACFHGTVTTTSTTPIAWALTVDLSQAPFNGAAPGGLSLQGADGWRYRINPNQPSAGFAQVVGRPSGGRTTIVAGQSYRVDLCDYSLPAGVDTPSAYTVATAQGTPWGPTQACLDTTVTGNGTSPFYVGWSTQVDAGPALARLVETGQPANAWTFGSNDWMVQRTQTSASTFEVTSTGPSTVAGTETFTFRICAVHW